jgi:hypothetical protein
MKISINDKLIKRNKLISQIVLYGALGLMGLGIIYSITHPDSAELYFAYLVIFPAYLLLQINILMADKWGKSPRLDEIISGALKGLDNRYSLYLYTTGISYLLVGPMGIWILNLYNPSGTITFNEEKKKYELRSKRNFLSKFLSPDSLSNVTRDTKDSNKKLGDYFAKIRLTQYPQLSILNVFYHPNAIVKVENSPEKTLKIDKLKDAIRQASKHPVINDVDLERIMQKLPETK